MTWPHGPQVADPDLMRLVARRFPLSAGHFLDIGSGSGANAHELVKRGHSVVPIDKDPQTPAFHIDIRDAENIGAPFDCIYDINTLCHVENPPFEKIKSWLKPDGYFFSIWPAYGTSERVKEGKDYTRLVTEYDLRLMLTPVFSEVRFGFTDYRLPDSASYQSWIVEARP